jgi:hypothetical protein
VTLLVLAILTIILNHIFNIVRTCNAMTTEHKTIKPEKWERRQF